MSPDVNDIEWMSANINVVHWTGGEPFISPLIIPGLEKMIKNKATHVKQVVITNGMFAKKQAQKVLDLLKMFDDVVMIVSVDGMGEIGEYSRTGWKESTFIENVSFLKTELPNACFVANFVLHSVSILGLYDTMKYCLDNDIKFQGQLIEGGASYLNYNLVKIDVYRQEFRRCCELKDTHPNGSNCMIEELIVVFFNHYNPTKFGETELEDLKYACKLRGQSGVYQRLMDGKLNED
jgi:sulfatase maturation enzyme AslB (radical SAM superfamily)